MWVSALSGGPNRVANVYLSIGSNIDRKMHIGRGLEALRSAFGNIECSKVYESEAVGFSGEDFYNLVVAINTSLCVGDLSKTLRDIENANGRDRQSPKFSARTLDIDILTYDNLTGDIDGVQLPRAEILHNAFVLRPLAELAPHALHPVLGTSYKQLWAAYNQQKQKLWLADYQVTP